MPRAIHFFAWTANTSRLCWLRKVVKALSDCAMPGIFSATRDIYTSSFADSFAENPVGDEWTPNLSAILPNFVLRVIRSISSEYFKLAAALIDLPNAFIDAIGWDTEKIIPCLPAADKSYEANTALGKFRISNETSWIIEAIDCLPNNALVSCLPKTCSKLAIWLFVINWPLNNWSRAKNAFPLSNPTPNWDVFTRLNNVSISWADKLAFIGVKSGKGVLPFNAPFVALTNLCPCTFFWTWASLAAFFCLSICTIKVLCFRRGLASLMSLTNFCVTVAASWDDGTVVDVTGIFLAEVAALCARLMALTSALVSLAAFAIDAASLAFTAAEAECATRNIPAIATVSFIISLTTG